MSACRMTAITGILNQDPNVCITNPLNIYSSAMHCRGPSMVRRMKLRTVNLTVKF